MSDHAKVAGLARLAGALERDGEPGGCSLVFRLETMEGEGFDLTYGGLMEALEFAQAQGALPAWSPHWAARAARRGPCAGDAED